MASVASADRGDENAGSDEARSAGAGENHAKMMIVGAGARFLFYPTLFYNVVRNRVQPEVFHWWDEIDQFLLLGAVPFPCDVPRLKEAGVHAVVTLNEPYETLVHTSLYKDQGINHLAIPTRDYLFAPSFANLRRAIQFIHVHAQLGLGTYVHCKAGRGRSTTVVICYLVEHRGMTPLEALNLVRSKRPRVLLAASQWKAVLDYSSQLFQPPVLPRLPALNFQSLHISSPTPKERLLAKPLDCSSPSVSCAVTDDLVLVSSADLIGYRSIEDAGLVGNELWKDVSLVCRFRLVAVRNFRAASSWIGTQSRPASLETCKKMAAAAKMPPPSAPPPPAFALEAMVVPVFQSSMVN